VSVTRPTLAVVVGLGLALLASACAGSGNNFVQNDEYGVYARVPGGWTVFDNDEILEAVTGRDPDSRPSESPLRPRVWLSGFDARDDPTAGEVIELGTDEPRGYVQILQLTRSQREQINLSTMRGSVLGVDPLASNPLTGQSGGDAEVLTDEPVEFDGGYHGLHTVIAIQPQARGEQPTVIDQTAVLNSTSSLLYLLVVSCNEDCYFETSHDDTTEIVDSWAIEEDGS
jgi:hypothetical protein